jgi:tubulin-specific chaperone E
MVILDSMLIHSSNSYQEIRETCPRIEDLDLSRNLFRSLKTVGEICLPLKRLRTLRLTGNRFWDIQGLEGESFMGVDWLGLNMCCLRWDEVFSRGLKDTS